MSSTVGKLSATDRKQLCKITEGRFEVLSDQLRARKYEIRSKISDQVLSDHESDIKATREKLLSIEKEREQLAEQHSRSLKDLDYKRTQVINEASDRGLKVSKTYNNQIGNVEPKNLDASVNKRAEDITKQFDVAKINLRTMELGILENISVAGLESDQAKDFLGEIPTIDQLLPSPEEIPQLQN